MTTEARPIINCRKCGVKIFDGLAIRSITVLRVLPGMTEAKCKRCKNWVKLPLVYDQNAGVA